MNKTLDYYNQNALQFIESTINVDFCFTQNKFLNELKDGAIILDFGCGSGRDTKYFMDKGYKVTAIDGSIELCNYASEYTGIAVKHMMFDELDEIDSYDGVWACSSILHLPYDELKKVMNKIFIALKEKGILYTSFKYGEAAGERDGRYFTNMTERLLQKFLDEIQCFELVEYWVTGDVRPRREDEKWLNVLLRKKS